MCSLFPTCPQTWSLSSSALQGAILGTGALGSAGAPGEEPQTLPFLPYTTPHPSPTTMPTPAPRARGSQSPCGDPALLPPRACSPQLSPQPITLLRRPRLHLHPARTLSDTARNAEVTEKREKEPESQNQMKPFNDAMNQRTGNENMMAFKSAKIKKGNTHHRQGCERTHTPSATGGNMGGCRFQASNFTKKHQNPQRTNLPSEPAAQLLAPHPYGQIQHRQETDMDPGSPTR